jgi:transcriptional regulator with XRE-family HTH domain
MASPGRPGNARLRDLRKQRALTQHDVAERLDRLALLIEGVHVGVNADMVSKWERGEKQPTALYVRLLSELFDRPPADLGLSGYPALAAAGSSTVPSVANADLLDMLELLSDSSAAAEVLRPKMLELGRRQLLDRRQLLKVMGVAPAAAGLEAVETRFASPGASPLARGSRALDGLREAVRELEMIYHSVDPRRMLMPVRALVETIEDALPEIRERSRRRLTLGLLARANLLAGRLTLFDVHRPLDSRAHLDLAREAAQEAGDDLMVSAVFGHMAFLPAAKRNYSASASYLAAARHSSSRRPLPPLNSWLDAVDGELNTWAGSLDAARRCHERARAVLPASSTTPAWFDFFDAKRLAGFEGFTLRSMGDLDGARAKLEAAMRPGPEMGPKQRAVTAIDLAGVCVASGDMDTGCRLASEAAQDLHRVGYAMAVDRLRAFRRSIPVQRHPAVRLLDDQLAELRLEEQL